MIDVTGSNVYETEGTKYSRKDNLNEDWEKIRLQGLKDQL